MDYGTNGQSLDRLNELLTEVQSLTVDKLKQILRHEGLTVSGVKYELQHRVIARKSAPSCSGVPAVLGRLARMTVV